MENKIIFFAVTAIVFAGLFFIALLYIWLQRRQLFQHETYIETLERQKDPFPDKSYRITQTGPPRETINNLKLDENYMRKQA